MPNRPTHLIRTELGQIVALGDLAISLVDVYVWRGSMTARHQTVGCPVMRRETLAVALLATATFLAYAWSAHFWVEQVDEGYFLDMADRVVRGELPYRDFTTYYTPGIFYLFAATFKLFGANLLWPRYLMALLRVATLLLTYGLARRVAPWPIALLPFVVLALLDHWPIEPEPHPSWPAIVLCLATMECAVRHFQSGRPIWLALAGACRRAELPLQAKHRRVYRHRPGRLHRAAASRAVERRDEDRPGALCSRRRRRGHHAHAARDRCPVRSVSVAAVFRGARSGPVAQSSHTY